MYRSIQTEAQKTAGAAMFRKMLLLLMLAAASNAAPAQITKGNWLMGGTVSFDSYKTKVDDILTRRGFEFACEGNVGYFFIDKLTAGIRSNLRATNFRNPSVNGTRTRNHQSRIGLGPFSRYYFLGIDNRVNVFADAHVLYTVLSNNTDGSNDRSWTYSLGAGAAVFLNSSVAIELLLAYKYYQAISYNASDNQIHFKLGFQYYLERENGQ